MRGFKHDGHFCLYEQLVQVSRAGDYVVHLIVRDDLQVFLEVVAELEALGSGIAYALYIASVYRIYRIDHPSALRVDSELCTAAALIKYESLRDVTRDELVELHEYRRPAIDEAVFQIPIILDYAVHLVHFLWGSQGDYGVTNECYVELLFSRAQLFLGSLLSEQFLDDSNLCVICENKSGFSQFDLLLDRFDVVLGGSWSCNAEDWKGDLLGNKNPLAWVVTEYDAEGDFLVRGPFKSAGDVCISRAVLYAFSAPVGLALGILLDV